MRLPDTAHTSRPWRIHELRPDFRVEDVWELPWRGTAEEFPRFVEMITSGDPARSSSRAVRTLFAIRKRIGERLGWDDPDSSFDSLYESEDEYAAEIANRTVRGVLHIGRVPDGAGGYRAQMAVLVKPNGLFGETYMAAIRPFRRLIVYPALLRQWERAWQRRKRTHRRHQMQEFRNAIERRDIDALKGLFADDVVFRSPVVYKAYEGRDQVMLLLGAVAQVFEDFRYTREIGAPGAADSALVFQARVGDREVEGCDFIHVNDDGLIDELYVMVRPMSGLTALAEAMKRQLAAA